MPPHELTGRRVTVMGLGQFGGGLGAVRFLLDRGAIVTLTDLRSPAQLASSLAQLDLDAVHEVVLGEHRPQDFIETDLVVVNPAVRPEGNRFLQLAREHKIPLTSEMHLFWQHHRGQVIAVTGTVGKSTTATLIHQSLQRSGVEGRLGGNIGRSLLPEVDRIATQEWVVLELSSFQLSDLQRLCPAPQISVVTNFYPNHLDWHPSLEDYRNCKQAICRWQQPTQWTVLNADDADVSQWPGDGQRIWFGTTLSEQEPGVTVRPDGLSIRWGGQEWSIRNRDLAPSLQMPHQRMNAAAALAALLGRDASAGQHRADISPMASAFREFDPLPHRLTPVAVRAGRLFINDSKATTPEGAIAALDGMTRPTILIAGGKDKGVDLAPLMDAMAGRAKGVILIGETAAGLKHGLHARGFHFCELAADLSDAFQRALRCSTSGDAVLLSPGCASYPEFSNYEDRGRVFQELVLHWSADGMDDL